MENLGGVRVDELVYSRRMSIVKNALKEFNRDHEPGTLLYPETWKPLVKAAIAGKPEALKYKNEQRLESFIQKGIINQTITTPRGSQEVVQLLLKQGLSQEQTQTFLDNVTVYTQNRCNAWWANAINPNEGFESVEEITDPEIARAVSTDIYDYDSNEAHEDLNVERSFQEPATSSPLFDQLGSPPRSEESDNDGKENSLFSIRPDTPPSKVSFTLQHNRSGDSSSSSSTSTFPRKTPKIPFLSDKSNICSSTTKLSRKRLHIKPRRFNNNNIAYDAENRPYRSFLTGNIPMGKSKSSVNAKLGLAHTDLIIENATPPNSPAVDNPDCDGDENAEPIQTTSSPILASSHIPVKRYKSQYHESSCFQEGINGLDNDDDIESKYERLYGGLPWQCDKVDSALRDNDQENRLTPFKEKSPLEYPRHHNAPILTQQMLDEIQEALDSNKEVLVSAFSLTIKRHELLLYEGFSWLEDINIDFYLELIRERNKSSNGKYPSVYIFHSFFFKLFEKKGHDAVKEATDNVCIFEYDMVFFPVHQKDHWRLISVDFRSKKLVCFDSMKQDNDECLTLIRKYLCKEFEYRRKKYLGNYSHEVGGSSGSGDPDAKSGPSKEAKKLKAPHLFNDKSFHAMENWLAYMAEDVPVQSNGSDCGIFCLQFAEYLSRDHEFDFSQDHMQYFRKRMMYETLSKHLLIE